MCTGCTAAKGIGAVQIVLMLISLICTCISLGGTSDDADTIKSVFWTYKWDCDSDFCPEYYQSFWGFCVKQSGMTACQSYEDVKKLCVGSTTFLCKDAGLRADRFESLSAMIILAFIFVIIHLVVICIKLCVEKKVVVILDGVGLAMGLLGWTFQVACWALAVEGGWKFDTDDIYWGVGFGASVTAWILQTITLLLGCASLAVAMGEAKDTPTFQGGEAGRA